MPTPAKQISKRGVQSCWVPGGCFRRGRDPCNGAGVKPHGDVGCTRTLAPHTLPRRALGRHCSGQTWGGFSSLPCVHLPWQGHGQDEADMARTRQSKTQTPGYGHDHCLVDSESSTSHSAAQQSPHSCPGSTEGLRHPWGWGSPPCTLPPNRSVQMAECTAQAALLSATPMAKPSLLA